MKGDLPRLKKQIRDALPQPDMKKIAPLMEEGIKHSARYWLAAAAAT